MPKENKRSQQAEKKKKGGAVRFMYKTFFKVPAWISFRQAKESSRVVLSYAKSAFNTHETEREETFEEALKRLNISKEQLQETYKTNTLP